MKKTSKRKFLAVFYALAVLLILGVCLGVSQYLLNYAIGRSGDGGNRQVALEVNQGEVAKTDAARKENAAVQSELTKAFTEQVSEQPVTIRSADGLALNAAYYPQAEGHNWAIVVHGYRGNHYGMLNFAQRYHAQGYHVLAPDLRGCGESEGSYVGMGWPDRLDMLRWIDWIVAQDADAEIVLHGVSMGAATVMMTSGEALPSNVVAFVEDCGYTGVWDIFASELSLRFRLPTFPLLNTASLLAKVKADYSFTEASALEQVKKCEKPMLFIHGDQDNFVPFDMMQPLYDAKSGENKQMLVVNGAGHGNAATVCGDAYWETVFAFIDRYRP